MVQRQSARLDIRIEPELLAAVEQIAKSKDRSVAWVVRDALRRYTKQKG